MSFGSARSERADRVFEVLEKVVAEYVRPAVEGTAVGGVEDSAVEDSAVEAPAG